MAATFINLESGKPLSRVPCALCGESIMDGREIEHQDETLCKPCFEKKNYYSVIRKLL
ncbi:MAG: TraR/DksA C4-type zinc finger protein [Deltaproteobacteria bacterium]|nr:TraR/DksA C4-type zinc finger protein [Deltaproteobacteria bacterium]